MNTFFKSLLFLFLPLFSLSDTGDSTHPCKTQFGIILSPDVCYRSLKADSDGRWMADMRDSMEVAKIGYSFGLHAMYTLNNRFALEIQVLFTNKGESTKKYDLNNTPLPYYKTSSKIAYQKNYYYLDIPLKINYYFCSGKKIRWYVTGGVSVNVFLGQSTIINTHYSDGTETSYIGKTQPTFNKINLAVVAGAGLNYDLTHKYSFKLEPVYKRSVHSIIDAPVKSYLYSIGLNIGIAYKF